MITKARVLNGMPPPIGARDRIMNAAYELFSQHGTVSVGIDTIVARSGVAKMTLYRHFKSKEDLILAFLNEREALWTHQWLEAAIMTAAQTPTGRLLAIFDTFDAWFQQSDFEGCAFINVLLESPPQSNIHQAAASHLANIRTIIATQAQAAGLAEADKFAHTWHFLMKGCIVAANEGNREAAKQAKEAGTVILNSWPRL